MRLPCLVSYCSCLIAILSEVRATEREQIAQLSLLTGFRSFSDVSTNGRNLATSWACGTRLLSFLQPLTMQNFLDCIRNKTDSLDMAVVGAQHAAQSECWCEHNVQAVVEAYECCEDDNFRTLCQMDCASDCTQPEAIACLDKCPPLCMEADYAPTDDCDCVGCSEHLKCIIEFSRSETTSGNLARICHDDDFSSATELLDFMSCVNTLPMRSSWNRYNAHHYCVCEENVKAAAEQHGCCGADWALSICDVDACKTVAECDTDESRACMDTCHTACTHIHPQERTQECIDQCFDGSTACGRFRSCKPVEQLYFEYVCDDGTPPADNGCCQVAPAQVGCPDVCNIKRAYHMQHGLECMCYDCPETIEQVGVVLNATLEAQIWQDGQMILVDIARTVGLERGPTESMQALLYQRNEELKEEIQQYGGPYDSILTARLEAVANRWQVLIVAEAERIKQCEADPSKTQYEKDQCRTNTTPTPAPVQQDASEDDDFAYTIPIVVGIVALLLAGIAGRLCLYMRAKKTKAAAAASNEAESGVEPVAGDSNVVVGRPVGGAAPAGASDAVGGAPVQASAKPKESSAPDGEGVAEYDAADKA